MFGCMHVTTHGCPKLDPPTFLFVRIRHYSKGNNIVWKKGRKSYEGMGFTTDWAHLGTTETHP